MGSGELALVLLFSVGLPLLVVGVVLRVIDRRNGLRLPRESTAEQVLRMRLALGEIDEAEYLRRLAALHREPGDDPR